MYSKTVAAGYSSPSRSAGLLIAFVITCAALAPASRVSTFRPSGQHRRVTRRPRPVEMNFFDYVNPNYWKREYVTAAMLSRQIPASASTVLELDPRDAKRLAYYPMTVSKVVTMGPSAEIAILRASAKEFPLEVVHNPGSIPPLDLPSNSVDVVVSAGVFERIEDKATLVQEAHRVLCPGGRLIFVEPLEDLAIIDASPFKDVQYDEEAGCAVGIALKGSDDVSPPQKQVQGQDGGNRFQRRASSKGGKKKRR